MQRKTLIFALILLLTVPLTGVLAQDDGDVDDLLVRLESNFKTWQSTPGIQASGTGTSDLSQTIDLVSQVLAQEETASQTATFTVVRVDGEEYGELVSRHDFSSRDSLEGDVAYVADFEARYVAGDVYMRTVPVEGGESFSGEWEVITDEDLIPVETVVFGLGSWFDPEATSIVDIEDILLAVAFASDVMVSESDGGMVYDVTLDTDAFVAYTGSRLEDDPESAANPLIIALTDPAMTASNNSSATYQFVFDAEGALVEYSTTLLLELLELDLALLLEDQAPPDSTFSLSNTQTATITIDGIDLDLEPIGPPEGVE